MTKDNGNSHDAAIDDLVGNQEFLQSERGGNRADEQYGIGFDVVD